MVPRLLLDFSAYFNILLWRHPLRCYGVVAGPVNSLATFGLVVP
jgi:hypothetical protein